MSVDIATLGIKVDASQADAASNKLDKLANSGDKAETKVKGLTKASDHLANAMQGLGIITTVDIAVQALGAAIQRTIGAAKEFSANMAEVSTLVDTATWNMSQLTDEVLRQTAAYGSSAPVQAKALYQIISAGATSAAMATDTLTASNKLAAGGVTDVATAADGLTSVLNAYGPKVEGATAVSDAMFTAMKGGKTTIALLSTSLGAVAPLAAQIGVSFDELMASTAALTKGGVSTSVAMTGLRAILAAVAKPSDEATKLAKRLGLEFNSAAIESMGFAKWLEEVKEKTHGNTDALAMLFGGVEALVPIMALTGQAGKDFTTILGQMENKAGATQEAVDKINASPAHQLDVILSSMEVSLLKTGMAFLDFMNPALTAFANLISGAVPPSTALQAILIALATVAAGAALRSIVGLGAAIAVTAFQAVVGSQAFLGFTAMVTAMGPGAAIAQVGMTGLGIAIRGVVAIITSSLAIFSALAFVVGGIVMSMWQQASVIDEVNTKYNEMNRQASSATSATDSAAGSARAAIPGFDGLSASVRNLADQFYRQADAAKKARIEAATTRLQEARALEQKATVNTPAMQREAFMNGRVRGDVLHNAPIVGNMYAGRIRNWLSGGRTDREANEAATRAFRMTQQAEKELEAALRSPNAPPTPTVSAPSGLNAPSNAGRANKPDKPTKSEAQTEYESAIKASTDYAERLKQETAAIGQNAIEIKMLEAARAATVVTLAGAKLGTDAAIRSSQAHAEAILAEANAWKIATTNQAIKDYERDLADVNDQIKFETSLQSMNTRERAVAIAMRAYEIKVRDAARNGIILSSEAIERETAAIRSNTEVKSELKAASERAREAADHMRHLSDSVRDATDSFRDLFGTAGEGFSMLVNAVLTYRDTQTEAEARIAEAKAQHGADSVEAQNAERASAEEMAQARMQQYGAMLGAAKHFFKEGSGGWKIMEAAEKAYRIVQFAMAIKAMLFDKAQTASSVANSGVRAAADGVAAFAKTLASLPFPFNLVAGAAVLAALVAVGVKIAGGGSKKAPSATASAAADAYSGPRDEYGAPTSSYSILRPGQTTVGGANDNSISPNSGSYMGNNAVGNSISFGDTHLTIEGGVDSDARFKQVQDMLAQHRAATVEDARAAVAGDMAVKASRQYIGGNS